jgi:hypothetical protein
MQGVSLLDVQAEPSATGLEQPHGEPHRGHAGAGARDRRRPRVETRPAVPESDGSFQQTGVILTVTPQITNNRQIQMRVHVENSDVQFEAERRRRRVPEAEASITKCSSPTVRRPSWADSRSPAIRYTKTGIPFLVDLPVIGRLFGVTTGKRRSAISSF